MATATTRKTAARIHPAANRKPLRYEHPFSTHRRCMAGTDGSAIGRGKSASSEATSAAGTAQAAKSFMPFDGASSRTKSMRLSGPEQSKPDATPTGTEVLAPNGANGRCHGFRNVRAREAPSPFGQIDRPEGIRLARDAGYSPLRAPETGAPAPAGALDPASRHLSASN